MAEERKLGTFETQLCLPERRRTQFAIKFFVVFALSLVFGVIVPLLFEGQRILPELHFKVTDEMRRFCAQLPHATLILIALQICEALSPWLQFLPQLAIVTGIVTISFYASTLARNTLQALAPAVLSIVVVSVLVITGSDPEAFLDYPLWRGWLVYLIGVPVLTFALAWLTYWNFKHVLIGWPILRRNVIVFFASLVSVIAVTTTVHHRAWQRLTPLEPPHNLARLTSSQPTTMKYEGDILTVQLPDGRVWSSRLTFSVPNLTTMLSGDWKVAEILRGGSFLEGTNWASVAKGFRCVVGIQKDGSLWVLENPGEPWIDWPQGQSSKPNSTKLVRLGKDNNWKSVLSYTAGAILLKTDGTLWRLGPIRFDWKKTWPGLHTFEPQRLGTDSDWAEVSPALDGRIAFYKADGRVWMSPKVLTFDTEKISLDDEITIYRATAFDRQKSVSSVWASAQRTTPFQVGVHEDGTFRVDAAWGVSANKPSSLQKQNVQLGKESGWLAVAGNFKIVVTLKTDGSLWKWSFPEDPITNPDTAFATRLSTHSDWVAIASGMDGVFSLAADGSLWFWQFNARYYGSPFTLPPLLAASRKPQLIGNIFTSSAQ